MRLLLASFALLFAACPGPPAEICGQSTELPTIASGKGEATRSDGGTFSEEGTWAPAPSSSIDIGTLTMKILNDDQGLLVDDLVSDGAFPICVPMETQSETSGFANLVDEGLATDATHTGGVAILAKEGDDLVGRFGFELANGGTTVTFSDGVFRVPQR